MLLAQGGHPESAEEEVLRTGLSLGMSEPPIGRKWELELRDGLNPCGLNRMAVAPTKLQT